MQGNPTCFGYWANVSFTGGPTGATPRSSLAARFSSGVAGFSVESAPSNLGPIVRYFLFFGGLIMMCAPAVPEDISHGALSLDLVESPVDSGVAKGT